MSNFIYICYSYFYAIVKIERYKEQIESLNEQIKKKSDVLFKTQLELESANVKLDFYDKNIVFVTKEHGNFYCSYEDVPFVSRTLGEYEAYNEKTAISLGYKKWK